MSTKNNLRFPERRTGFTLVEILVTLTILATISIVAYTWAQGYIKKSYNTERIASIGYLKTSLSDYLQIKKNLPEPTSNAIYYDERWAYYHSSSGAYGVSGFASNDFLPAGYANFSALDPETKQFYAYGKRSDNSTFDLAAVIYEDGSYKTYLQGTYDGKKLASLIRSYASSDFVSNGSTDALPYNPYDRKITAHIESYSWSVQAISSNNSPLALTGELNAGDKIVVATGALATVHISDGSETVVGSSSGTTELEFASLAYSDDNNLASKVALFLHSGETWAKAPKLRTMTGTSSDFSIQTDTAVAAVRGTIFGVASQLITWTNSSHTDIMVAEGKVEIMNKSSSGFVDPTETNLSSFVSITPMIFSNTGSFVSTNGHTYIQNADSQSPVRFSFEVSASNQPVDSETGTVDPVSTGKKLNLTSFSRGFRPRVASITSTGILSPNADRTLIVGFENPGANWYELSYTTNSTKTVSGALDPESTTASASGTFTNKTGFLSLRLCQKSTSLTCSLPFTTKITDGTFALNGLADMFDRIGSKNKPLINNTPVPTACVNWANMSSCDPNLVAIARYDDNLKLYLSGVTLTETANSLGDTAYEKFNTASGIFFDNTGGVTSLWDANLYNLGFPIKKPFNNLSIYEWGDSTGIFLDNFNNSNPSEKDYLYYNLSSSSLPDYFKIEIRVRWAALKRTGSGYYLFQNKDETTSKSDLKLNLNWGGDLQFTNINGANSTWSTIVQATLSSLTGEWYKIVAEHSDRSNIKIFDDSDILKAEAYGPSFSSIGLSKDLYVGSSQAMTYQWNDIIDYVKIYKLP